MKTRRDNQRLNLLLSKFAGKIAKCHSGRYGRVTAVELDGKGRVVYKGHHVDPPGTVYLESVSQGWRDWNGINWQSIKPQWVT